MGIINEITLIIIKNAEDGESIHSLASKLGFAYSAVYRWILELEKYGVIGLIRNGNRDVIKINENLIYKKFKELDGAVYVIEKDNNFWELVKTLKLKIRFVKGTAAVIWTQGNFITGDFYDRIYFLEVEKKDTDSLKKALRKNGLPSMPLKELVSWCKELDLENILEQLDILYNLKLNAKYSEVSTNV